jgi:hypothetical protein
LSQTVISMEFDPLRGPISVACDNSAGDPLETPPAVAADAVVFAPAMLKHALMTSGAHGRCARFNRGTPETVTPVIASLPRGIAAGHGTLARRLPAHLLHGR